MLNIATVGKIKELLVVTGSTRIDVLQNHLIHTGILNKIIFIRLKLKTMLKWSATFFVIAIVAAIFGFTGIAAGAAFVAKFLFFLFIILFLGALVLGITIFKKK